MTIKCRYQKNGSVAPFELDSLGSGSDHHEIVMAALTEIANRERERIYVYMMSAVQEGQVMGTYFVDPQVEPVSSDCTIESVQICVD